MKKSPKNKPGKIAPEDVALFRAAVGAVRPLAEQNRAALQSAPRQPVFHRPDDALAIPDTLSDFAGDEVAEEFLANGLSRMALRKLRRETWPVQDTLDLHGNHSDAARKLLQVFLHEATLRDIRCVLVIHGKGLNSKDGEAVLRKLARHWLSQHPQVLGYCNAPPRLGGSGAALVLLKGGKG